MAESAGHEINVGLVHSATLRPRSACSEESPRRGIITTLWKAIERTREVNRNAVGGLIAAAMSGRVKDRGIQRSRLCDSRKEDVKGWKGEEGRESFQLIARATRR